MNSNARFILISGALLAGLGIALGAFGSHALSTLVSADRLSTWETAVRYQLIHALALLALGSLQWQLRTLSFTATALCWLLGSLVFSGSLYALVLLNLPLLGALTPLGGVVQLVGWVWLSVQLIRWRPAP